MKFTRCDRCGQIIYDGVSTIQFFIVNSKQINNNLQYDLCLDCIKHVQQDIKDFPK